MEAGLLPLYMLDYSNEIKQVFQAENELLKFEETVNTQYDTEQMASFSDSLEYKRHFVQWKEL